MWPHRHDRRRRQPGGSLADLSGGGGSVAKRGGFGASGGGGDPLGRVPSLPPRSHVVSELFGDPNRRISGVSAACVDVDDDVVPVCQRTSAAPAGSGCILLTRNRTECA